MSEHDRIGVSLEIPFPTAREAEIAYNVLRIDSEPKRSNVRKTLELKSNRLILNIHSEVAKNARVAATSFFESLLLCCETIDQFGPPVSEQYTHF